MVTQNSNFKFCNIYEEDDNNDADDIKFFLLRQRGINADGISNSVPGKIKFLFWLREVILSFRRRMPCRAHFFSLSLPYSLYEITSVSFQVLP